MKSFAIRAGTVAGAYLVTGLTVMLMVVALRQTLPPPTLRELLGFYFVAALAAGLDPGTAKALFIGESREAGLAAVLGASALKALVVAPVLGVVWRFAAPGLPLAILLTTPLIVIAGFWATDVRVLLDLRGRHASAVWLKQGSLAAGFVLAAILVGSGLPLLWAVLISSLARLSLPVLAGWTDQPLSTGTRSAIGLLSQTPWIAFAGVSVLGAAGGSIDRVVALRWLPAANYSGYYLLYELFSRFWLLPYLLTPILFARIVAGQGGGVFAAWSWRFTWFAGFAFVIWVAGVAFCAPGLLHGLLGVSFGLPTVAFAGAIAISALTQLRVAELQAAGGARHALLATLAGTLVAVVAFGFGVRHMGVDGLLWAWLLKSAAEFSVAMAGGRRNHLQ